MTLFTCNIDSDVFHQWVEYCLLPNIPQNCVIVMDNATFHKRHDTQLLIEQSGHIIEYLAPYSPDLNSIERQWAKKKKLRRRLQCTIDELFK